MIRNYLKIALRNIRRYPAHSILNTIGLAIGMACAILILLWVNDEWSYDRHFDNADYLYRVIGDMGTTNGESSLSAVTLSPLAKALKEEYPEIIRSSRCGIGSLMSIKIGDEFIEETAVPVDNDFLKMFNVEFIAGDINNALNEPNNIVLTEKIARKYFGNENPMGKTLKLAESDEIYTVTGVVKNPHHSHLLFDLLIPIKLRRDFDLKSDIQFFVHNYIELKKGTDSKLFNEKIRNFLKDHSSRMTFPISLQNIKKIHLFSSGKYSADIEGHGDITYVRILSLIAIFILIIACINFMNLSTAQSVRRAKEIGLRKMAGAGKQKIIFQFLGESLLIVFVAHIIAMILVELLLPEFNNLTGKQLVVNYQSVRLYIGLIVVVLFCGLMAGMYPALYLSSLKPLNIMKGVLGSGRKKAQLRRILVILQFSLSILLIICTLIIGNQFKYIQNKKLGFNKDNIVYFRSHISSEDPRLESLKKSLSNNPDVLSITRGDSPVNNNFIQNANELNWTGKENDVQFDLLTGDADYAKTFQLEMKEGRFFSSEFSTDSFAIVINEQAAKIMNFDDPIGKTVTWPNGDKWSIIGVVKDFHYKSMYNKIEPLIIFLGTRLQFFIRMRPGTSASTIDFINNTFNSNDLPFRLDLHYLDEDYDNLYRNERRIGRIFRYFSFLAIIISCLGLIGLSSFMAERRTKEIGIRKANGAKSNEIFILLSKEYIIWVLISIIIASPIAGYFMNKWLQNFAYRSNMNVWLFVLAGVIALIVALLTVGFQSYKAAAKNPVEALRYE
jgi:ABC-type antimicrobial peptide transport system permease subunit